MPVLLALAYGATVVIPNLQRQHSQPERMSCIIIVSMGVGTVFFLAIDFAGYASEGYQISGNLLFSAANTSDPNAMSTLGFVLNSGAVIVAYIFMHVHIVIAFSTIVMPAFFMAEWSVLGTHKDAPAVDQEQGIEIVEKLSSVPVASPATPDFECNYTDNLHVVVKCEDEFAEYRGKLNVLRLCVLTLLEVAFIFLCDHFLDLVDFTGASALTTGNLVLHAHLLPQALLDKLPMYERVDNVSTQVSLRLQWFVGLYMSTENSTCRRGKKNLPLRDDKPQPPTQLLETIA
ncbi:Amino Acid/Auxin Permease (AAAP) Family [Phytophthora cinnamomi]|uniref:Amino Acid/Auxin Permease (AAAP) Family n=1 Tax=Phytophthora cinnamomi TaxID=4785 RepID=UPI003559B277|nr:Amino Acid/Auxin Permease (AAAP) Family [Phytophthora cinnamomi]